MTQYANGVGRIVGRADDEHRSGQSAVADQGYSWLCTISAWTASIRSTMQCTLSPFVK